MSLYPDDLTSDQYRAAFMPIAREQLRDALEFAAGEIDACAVRLHDIVRQVETLAYDPGEFDRRRLRKIEDGLGPLRNAITAMEKML